jgi:hypothetical protein
MRAMTTTLTRGCHSIDGGSGILQLSEMPYKLVQTNTPDARHDLLSVSSPKMKPQRERYTNKSPMAQVL